jgi:2-polyprenyl-3-methyl-5-hydroxy-6-metoxy-1,4-benzoquinol methylase
MVVEQCMLVTPPQGPFHDKRESTPLTAPTVSPMMFSLVSQPSCVFCQKPLHETVLETTVRGAASSRTFKLLRCGGCGLVTTIPCLPKSELEACYQPEYWGRASADDLAWVRRDQRPRTAFLECFRREGRLLDVGCGLGLFLVALDPQRWDRHGLEAMPAAYREAVSRLGADRIVMAELTAAEFPPEHFDVITFWDVLEHLPDPVAALRQAFRFLRPGGLLLLRLPNFAGYTARRFGEDWYELALPYHLYHFTPASLTHLLEASGFRVCVVEASRGTQHYHALKHSLLRRLTRLHGPRGGRLRYYLLKLLLHPWEWISTRWGGGSSMQVCAERPLAPPS